MLASFLQSVLFVTFLVSGVAKLFGMEDFMKTFEQLEIKTSLARLLAPAVILLEIMASLLFILPQTQLVAYMIILFLLACFSWSVYRAYTRKLKVACNCFGNLQQETFGWNTVIRIVLLLAVDGYLMATGTTVDWFAYPLEEILYALVGSIGVLMIYMMLPYALFGRVGGQASK